MHHIIVIALAAALGAAGAATLTQWGLSSYEKHTAAQSGPSPLSFSPSCNVLGVQVVGGLVATRSEVPSADMIPASDGSGTLSTPNYTISSDVEYYLESAAGDPNIKGVVIDVNSTGGDAVAGQEIARAIRALGKPSVGVIHTYGDSAGYLSAVATDRVFALENSDVGSIGATASFINQYEKDKKDGIVYEQLSSGPYKDMFSPDKPLTDAEKKLILRDIQISHDTFVKLVAEYRHQPIEKITALADGSVMLGQAALENGLIDELGGLREAKNYLGGQIGEEPNICWQ